ncbi:MAG TPA: site-specific integrase [Candidatus Bacteroides intestinigallinarum]|nr:site-specific integrase [Candidatus Bacteroides intestinigallinarum]
MKHENNLRLLMEHTAFEMERLGYSANSMKHYWEVWHRYLKFTNEDTVNRTDMDSFLADKYGIDIHFQKFTRYQRTALRAMNVLEYFSKTGKIYIRFPLSNPVPIDNRFIPVVERFVLWMRETGYAETTIHTHERVVRRFLDSAVSYGLEDIASIDAAHISNFIMEITGHRGKATYELNSLRVFFRYLYRSGMVTEKPALFIPASNRLRIREHLPSVWEDEDVSAILQCVDRGNPVGKRDYAMILLAVRLGLRGSDIKKLCFSDIDWEKETLTVTQQKTKELIVLPLTNEIGTALIDYLKAGRPVSSEPYIFLALRAPYTPLSKDNHLHHVLNKYIKRSGITLCADKAHGMHSMRHTLASRLLEQGTPIPVISGILGHRDSSTTMEYLRIDVEQLRSCTLEMEVRHEK